jgi:hypothetical protein
MRVLILAEAPIHSIGVLSPSVHPASPAFQTPLPIVNAAFQSSVSRKGRNSIPELDPLTSPPTQPPFSQRSGAGEASRATGDGQPHGAGGSTERGCPTVSASWWMRRVATWTRVSWTRAAGRANGSKRPPAGRGGTCTNLLTTTNTIRRCWRVECRVSGRVVEVVSACGRRSLLCPAPHHRARIGMRFFAPQEFFSGSRVAWFPFCLCVRVSSHCFGRRMRRCRLCCFRICYCDRSRADPAHYVELGLQSAAPRLLAAHLTPPAVYGGAADYLRGGIHAGARLRPLQPPPFPLCCPPAFRISLR